MISNGVIQLCSPEDSGAEVDLRVVGDVFVGFV